VESLAINARIDWAQQALRAKGVTITSLPARARLGTWSMLARFGTDQGPVWLKYVRGAYRQEPAITARLHSLAPDLVPELLARNDELASWLVRDSGTQVTAKNADGRALTDFWPVLDAHTGLQQAAMDQRDQFLTLGAKDVRPAAYSGYLHDLLNAAQSLQDDQVPADTIAALQQAGDTLVRLVGSLQAIDPPQSVVHMDLRLTNLKQRGGRLRIIDWGDAGVGPVFLDPVPLLSELEHAGASALDLADLHDRQALAWRDHGTSSDLRHAQSLCRVVFPLLFAHGLIACRPTGDPSLRPGFSGFLRSYLQIFLRRLAETDL
jgi:hypothetical protein